MPSIFLSPSLQEWNPYVNGGNEEYYMNLIADAIEPYLRASGITYGRNTPSQTLSQAIAQSNAGSYDLHLAIHSNAAGEQNSGAIRGTDVYYYPSSSRGKRAAELIAENYKNIYPLPDRVKTVASSSLAELRRTKAPAVLIETAYHDNLADAEWIQENIGAIGRNLAQSVAEFLGVPFVDLS
ncbi:N-acetylmuramoyl-L-alanine amidase [Ruminococcus sp.]|uniref:N-acetylmuramoyl-L-alanine amidase family protein n=1 Tax=Ruminococcus sp. TaxID=41978 RepID=UPI0038904C04